MRSKAEFVTAAIIDTQSTIRAIDVKIGALLVAILAPLTGLGRIFRHIENISAHSPQVFNLIISVVFVAAWLLALTALIRGLSAIDNPSDHIVNATKRKGSFYGGGLYAFGILDAFLNRSIIKANKDPVSFSTELPDSEADILDELVFEHMKLIYIRDAKLNRLKWAMRFSLVWLSFGIFIYLSSKYLFG